MMDDYSAHFNESSFWDKLRQFAFKAGRQVVKIALVLYYCLRDPDTPASAKAIIASSLGYFIFPLDAIPDMSPLVGYSDDLGALLLATTIVAAHIKPKHQRLAEDKLRDWFGNLPGNDEDAGTNIS
jgi:uncharacterized membrane protein YkvA (DUF1232 family)